MLTRPTSSVWATAERMSRSSSWKPPRRSVCRAVSSVSTALWVSSRFSLAFSASSVAS